MKDAEIRGRLEAIRDNLALIDLEPTPLGEATLAQVNELLKLLEANPPLAEVEGWVSRLGISGTMTSQGLTIWPKDEPKGWLTPVTVTIRRKAN